MRILHNFILLYIYIEKTSTFDLIPIFHDQKHKEEGNRENQDLSLNENTKEFSYLSSLYIRRSGVSWRGMRGRRFLNISIITSQTSSCAS
ncbi:hypothetical protein CM19_03940 [Candidatus Acidianus copahuensis]|uniref:Uncharacterized protein n=1 Tax=Candidatus Acidianus copahuensis TaxID=1160895 RepID=A0A031LU35_9CREN|nr:hypothetical protein CM19_03940 [Candidatus Acidianus copahuensis]